MKNRYVVLANAPSPEQQDKLTTFFKNEGMGFWHHYRDSWIVTDQKYQWTAEQFLKKIHELVPGMNALVFRINYGAEWAAYGHTEAFEWFHSEWDRD